MNRIAIKVNCYKGYSYLETLDGIKNAGFKYVELTTSKGNSLNLYQDSSLDFLKKLKNDLETRDLKVIAIGGNGCLMDDDKSKLLRNIELGKYFGCEYIDTTINSTRVNQINDEDIIEQIKFFIPYLKESNLDLVIELCGSYSTGDSLSNIINVINDKHVHINYDTGNAIYWGKLKYNEMQDDFNRNIDHVSFMHLKDKLGKQDEINFPAVGSGDIDFKNIIDSLKTKNNKSTLTVEIEFTPQGVDSINEVNKAVIDSYKYLNSII